ncbi:uncharacterized protein LOC128707277 [Anopheles marshallii]|uniref:uncharacterized protein LOC128707277 n=1 Tax=Anopheles marshallii TaxID=1521116 RepID=UPI00237BB270|nr:uncharacterized protein LOC128707277 [Anopheles marshallii]
MSKSPASVVSSDETHSAASDESLVISAATSHTSLRSIGITKVVKKSSKDEPTTTAVSMAKERPPWRPASLTAVVVPPPPKPDIKARLLEASKRMRRVNAVVQTDPVHTKLMKEVSTDEQTDLIPMVDEEILTDGNLVIREVGNLILTHSVAQMTDGVETCDSGTQTAIPRSGISFRKFLEPITGNDHPTHQGAHSFKLSSEGDHVDVEAGKQESGQKQSILLSTELETLGESFGHDPTEQCSSQSGSDSMKETNTPDLISATVEGDPSPHRTATLLETPTFAAWQNLDFSDEESESYVPRELPRRPIGEGDRPWAEFKDLVIGSRVANMRLSPVPPRRPRAPNQKTVTWSDRQHRAVSKLINEASALVDMFDHVSLLLGPDITLHKLPPQQEFHLPPAKWEPLLTKSCDLLEEKLAQVRHLSLSDFENQALPLEPKVPSNMSPILSDIGPEEI